MWLKGWYLLILRWKIPPNHQGHMGKVWPITWNKQKAHSFSVAVSTSVLYLLIVTLIIWFLINKGYINKSLVWLLERSCCIPISYDILLLLDLPWLEGFGVLNIKLLYKIHIPLSTSSNFFPTLHIIYPGLHSNEILEKEKHVCLGFFYRKEVFWSYSKSGKIEDLGNSFQGELTDKVIKCSCWQLNVTAVYQVSNHRTYAYKQTCTLPIGVTKNLYYQIQNLSVRKYSRQTNFLLSTPAAIGHP